MADERYQWLDQEAAERLLRGEPVDALDDPARSEARRLAEALDSTRTRSVSQAALAARTELPGEAAALTAFREATAARAARATAVAAGGTAHAELGRVRLAPVTAPARRWGRSVRYGLAAAVAAVTVGGVAVAAGTGMLPLTGPEPASSVTAVDGPDPVASGSSGIRKDPEVPSRGPDGDDGSPGSSPSAPHSSLTSPSSTASPSVSSPPDIRPTPDPGRTTPAPGGTKGGSDVKEKALKACQDYRAGRLDAEGRRQLASTLRSGETLRRYCDRIVSGGTGGTGDSGTSAEPREGGKDDGKDDGKSDGDGDGNGNGGGSGDAPVDGRRSPAAGGVGEPTTGGAGDTTNGTGERRDSGAEDQDKTRR
ncbi:hypothetical protein [Streptomyces sp. NBC_00094]|uniref:hypothetical protein n=1 Tax=Streptomyces sp. NBC_00094 TaxID=2903620 RepID=UPI00224D7644|nr:hypothetical protein [Streptomyces sp. NBC_00094]MCX5392736.1 hypothetical protein [Streptomyces sp. NBC_00094]